MAFRSGIKRVIMFRQWLEIKPGVSNVEAKDRMSP